MRVFYGGEFTTFLTLLVIILVFHFRTNAA